LAELDLLKFVDYLSTVSGGGFIGSWFATWIKREGDMANVVNQLKPQRVDQAAAKRGYDPELKPGLVGKAQPEPIFHLREFSNYLSPKLSFFSGDSWALIAIYLRNFIANQLVLLPFITALLLLTRLYLVTLASRSVISGSNAALATGVLAVAAFAMSAYAAATKDLSWFARSIWAWCSVAIVASYWYACRAATLQQAGRIDSHLIATFGPPAVLMAIGLTGFLVVVLRSRDATEQEREWFARFTAWLMLLSTVWMGFFGISLYGALWFWEAGSWLRSTLTAGWIASALGGIAAGRSLTFNAKQATRWASLLAVVTPLVFLVGLGCALSLAINELVGVAPTAAEAAGIESTTKPIPTPSKPEHAPTEVIETQSSIGRSQSQMVRTRRHVLTPDELAIVEQLYWSTLAHSNPVTLIDWIVGMLIGSLVFAWLVDINEFSLNAMYANRIARCYLGASRRKSAEDGSGTPSHSAGPPRAPNQVTGFDVDDDLPLHQLRIGVMPTVNPNSRVQADQFHPYWGPFPLINTALNLVGGKQLAFQERKAESFILSPLFCGTESIGYRDTSLYAAVPSSRFSRKHKPLTLGRAVAISGAAASPNMGYHSMPALAALMTIFNVRLGWWLPNPRLEGTWRSSGPKTGITWIFRELFGFTDETSTYLNISDGGHFDNLGVYELVRRRCRFIIAVDAGADPTSDFEDLAGLIRKCRADFGIDINIELNQLRRIQGTRSGAHCAIGDIRYDQVDSTAPIGTLVYLKPSLTGDEPADILNYATKCPDFPQQSTLNQFFAESQFESYRGLGYHCAMQVFGPVVDRLRTSPTIGPLADAQWCDAHEADTDALLIRARNIHEFETGNLFYFLRKEWLSTPPHFDQAFRESAQAFEDLQRDFMERVDLTEIDRSLYPELKVAIGRPSAAPEESTSTKQETAKATRAPRGSLEASIRSAPDSFELHLASRLLQLMENAWMGIGMERYFAHPRNAGWMNLFRRWTNLPALRRYWPLLRNEYSRDFVRFCEHKLGLGMEISELLPLSELTDGEKETWKHICDEFRREWPVEEGSVHLMGLREFEELAWKTDAVSGVTEDVVEAAKKGGEESTPNGAAKNVEKACWYLRVTSKKVDDAQEVEKGFVAGIAALRELTSQEYLENVVGVGQDGHVRVLSAEERLQERDDRVLWTTDARRCYELLVWVRPSYRQQSIGTSLIEKTIDKLFDDDYKWTELMHELAGRRKVRLAVLYPKSGWRGPGDALEKTMWFSLFSFYDFRPLGRGCPHTQHYEVLALDSEP